MSLFLYEIIDTIFEWMENSEIDKNQLDIIENNLSKIDEFLQNRKILEREINTGVSIGFVYPSKIAKQLFEKSLFLLRNEIQKILKTETQTKVLKTVKNVNKSINNLNVFMQTNFVECGDFMAEFNNSDENHFKDKNDLAENKVLIFDSKVILRKIKKVKIVFLMEIISCNKCKKDVLLMLSATK